MTRVVAIDSSLTSAGIACLEFTGGDTVRAVTRTVRSSGRASDTTEQRARRIVRQRNGILDLARGADLVLIEAPAFAAKGAYAHEVSWLWGAVYTGLLHLGIPVVDVQPTRLKKFTTGKGSGPGSDKTAVAAAVARMWPAVDPGCDDEFDALALATMAAVHYRWPLPFNVLPRHLESLAGITWPTCIQQEPR